MRTLFAINSTSELWRIRHPVLTKIGYDLGRICLRIMPEKEGHVGIDYHVASTEKLSHAD